MLLNAGNLLSQSLVSLFLPSRGSSWLWRSIPSPVRPVGWLFFSSGVRALQCLTRSALELARGETPNEAEQTRGRGRPAVVPAWGRGGCALGWATAAFPGLFQESRGDENLFCHPFTQQTLPEHPLCPGCGGLRPPPYWRPSASHPLWSREPVCTLSGLS